MSYFTCVETAKKELLCALIGLSRAIEGNESKCTRHTQKIFLDGLYMITLSEMMITYQEIMCHITLLHGEKQRLVPRCATCKKKCGRNDDFPKDKMESLSEYAYQILQRILSIGLFVSHQGIDIKIKNQATDFLYKALFQVGNTNKQNPLFYENYRKEGGKIFQIILNQYFSLEYK